MKRMIYMSVLLLAVLGYALPAFSSAATAGATIESVTYEPKNPTTADQITIHARVSGDVQKVQLKYEACTSTMCCIIQTKDMVKSGDEYTATVGPFDARRN